MSVQLSWHVGVNSTPDVWPRRSEPTLRANSGSRTVLLNHFVGALQEGRRHSGPQRGGYLQVHRPPTAVKLKEFLCITDAELCAAAADHAEPREHGTEQTVSGGLRTGSALLVAVL